MICPFSAALAERMTKSLAYLNGELVAADQLSILPTDAGFVLGITVAEQLRTFAGRLFRLPAHLKRLSRSLEIVGIDAGMSVSDLAEVAEELVAHNHGQLAPGDDLGLAVFVTPGIYATFAPEAPQRPTVGMHTFPVPFSLWARRYASGQRVVIADIRQVPPQSWPAELKCRSRMHYYLAEARALLLDHDGYLSEASTANVVAYFEQTGLVSPPREKILPGISIAVLGELAAGLGIPLVYRDLTPGELREAEEMLLCSTSPCLLPVVSVDGRPVGRGTPGPIFRRLIEAWSDMVQVDIVAQATRFATR
jgi:branched-subunit amino acid aminotransferase/4-amino-4-deoxychorismate lyase